MICFCIIASVSKSEEYKMRVFINEPSFMKSKEKINHLQRSKKLPLSRSQGLKTIFPPKSQVERFHQLQQARVYSETDAHIDHHVLSQILAFQSQHRNNQGHDLQIETRKQAVLKKLKFDYVEEQMSENLEQLDVIMSECSRHTNNIRKQKNSFSKMMGLPQLKQALIVQNSILRKDNKDLKEMEASLDLQISSQKRNT